VQTPLAQMRSLRSHQRLSNRPIIARRPEEEEEEED
jgi:hypothetical protein